MRWTERQERVIKEVIKKYKRMLKKEDWDSIWVMKFCPFCEIYYKHDKKCRGCPNVRIEKLFDIKGDYLHSLACSKTLLLPKFQSSKELKKIRGEDFVKLRIEFWQDALKMSEKEFREKWRK